MKIQRYVFYCLHVAMALLKELFYEFGLSRDDNVCAFSFFGGVTFRESLL
jgi:hypothetical protein